MSYADLAEAVEALKDTNQELVSSIFGTTTEKIVPTIAALRKYDGASSQVRVSDPLTGDLFYWDPNDTTSLDNRGTIIVAQNGYRWKRVDNGSITAAMFGAKPGVSTVDSSIAIRDALAFARLIGGAKVKITRGRYACGNEIGLNPVPGLGWHNVTLEGDGGGSTILDFTNAAVDSNGINCIGWGGRFNIRGFTILGARNIGLLVNGTNRGTDSWVSRANFEDLIIDGSLKDNVQSTQSYMLSFKDIESRNSVAGYGFNFRGFHTSMKFSNCWAGGDAAAPQGGNFAGGWNINGMVYSELDTCGADWNTGPGFTIKAVSGVALKSCGGESNYGAAVLVVSDDLNIDNIPTPGVTGLVLDNFFAIGNGAVSLQTPNFLEVRSAGTREASVMIRGCNQLKGTNGSDVGIAVVGSGGTITIEEKACSIAGTRTKTGKVFWKNESAQGKSATLKLGANVGIPSGVATTLLFTGFDSNSLAAVINASGEFVVPSGVNRIKVTGGAFWDTSSVGSRTIALLKNGSSFYGGPSQKTPGLAYTQQGVASGVLGVVTGDRIALSLVQDTAGSLSVIANPNTFLAIEALG